MKALYAELVCCKSLPSVMGRASSGGPKGSTYTQKTHCKSMVYAADITNDRALGGMGKEYMGRERKGATHGENSSVILFKIILRHLN